MENKFKETQLDQNFSKEYSDYARKLINASISFTVIGMQRVCTSSFLRYLALQDYAHFVHFDVRALSSRTNHDFFRLLLEKLGYTKKVKADEDPLTLCRNQLVSLLKTHKKIVIMIIRFEDLKDCMDRVFLSNLHSLHDVDKRNIVFVTTATRPLDELLSDVIGESNMELFSKVFYFKPYSIDDMKRHLSISSLDLRSKEELSLVLKYAGGHVNLMQLLLKTDYLYSPLQDPFIKLQLKMIYENFSSSQQKQIQQVVKGKDITVDDFVTQVGMVKEVDGKKVLFSPLMEQYIASQLPQKLSGKEGKLFYLLKKNKNTVVSKDAIFSHVWKDDYEDASDWALNSLVYRLRKNTLYINSGYDIESHKGMGYRLVKK